MTVVSQEEAAPAGGPEGRTSRLTIGLAVGLTLLIGLGATTWATRLRAAQDRDDRTAMLESLTDDTVARGTADLQRYADLLEAMAAFQSGSDRSMAGYESYVDQLDVSRYPGVDNTAYIQYARDADLAGLVAQRRADGQPGFAILASSDGPDHAVVAYAAPTPSAVPGYDIMRDPARRAALRFAADSGTTALSGAVVPLAQLNLPASQQTLGLVAYVAVYAPGAAVTTAEERRLALLGWTSISLDLEEVVRSLRLDEGLLDVVLLIDDEDGTFTPVGQSRNGAAEHIAIETESTSTMLPTGGRNIEIRAAFAPGRAPDIDTRLIAGGGALISLLAAYGVYATLRFRRGLLAQAATEHLRAELVASRFHAAVDRAPVGVTVVGLDGEVELINERLAELLQVSVSDNASIASYYLPEEIPELVEKFGQLTRGEVDHSVSDRRLRRADGSVVWCRISTSVLVGPDGKPSAIIAHVEDIEAERRAVEELRSRSRWFSSIVERSSDLISLLDRDGVVTWASPSTMEILGNAPELLIGVPIVPLVLSEDRARLREAIRLVQTGVQVRVEYRVRTLAGKVIWLETTANSLLDDPDVASIITFSRDVTERHRTDELLTHRASHDPLTGLLNRSQLVITLDAALAGMRESGEPLSVAFLDLDGFKAVNDGHGHAVGDELLRVVAAVLNDEVRVQDAIARLGGDEFVVVLRGVGLPGAVQIAERIRRRLHGPLALEGTSAPVPLSISIGLAAGSTADTVDSLLHEADLALYEAKRGGRDRVEISSHGLAELGLHVEDLVPSLLGHAD